MEGAQLVQSNSRAQQPLQPQTCVQEHCPGETGLPSSVFQAVSEDGNVCSTCTTFQSPELLNIQCGFIWKETMQLVPGKVEFNACQVSLLLQNSFLVSLQKNTAHHRTIIQALLSFAI